MFGDKEFAGVGYPTPVSFPEDTTCLLVQVPASSEWWAIMIGLLYSLTFEDGWQQFEGGMSREDAAAHWSDMFNDALDLASTSNQCEANVPAPYWETALNSDDEEPANAQEWYGELVPSAALAAAPGGFLVFDADPDYHWTEKIADWILAGFLAIAFSPAAGIKYITFVPKARIAFRRQDWGAFARIFINGILDREVDTYSPVEDLINEDVDLSAYTPNEDGSHEIWIANSDTHNEAATPTADGYGIAVVRKNIEEGAVMTYQLRQNPDNACQLQQSDDGGDTWTLAFDYSLCIPPAQQTILETVINNNTWVNPFSPTITFISQSGYNDTQKDAAYQALCYAVGALVESMASAAYQAKQGELTTETLVSIGLGIASAILLAFDILTFGAFTPVALAIAGAALAAIAAIEALSAGVWLDADNLAALKCLALANLTNLPVTLANFQTAFHHADCLTSDQQAMAAIFAAMLSNVGTAQDLYDNYLNTIGNANSAAQSGVLAASCVCEDSWSWSWDFSEGNYGIWEVIFGTVAAGGLICGENADGWPSIGRVDAEFFMPDGSEISQVDVFWHFPGSGSSWQLRLDYEGYGGAHDQVNNPPSCPTPFTSNIGGSGSKTWSIFAAFPGTGADMLMTGIKVTGSGANPFGTCNADPPC